MDLLFDQVFYDKESFQSEVLNIHIPEDLCVRLDRPAKEDVVARCVSWFHPELVWTLCMSHDTLGLCSHGFWPKNTFWLPLVSWLCLLDLRFVLWPWTQLFCVLSSSPATCLLSALPRPARSSPASWITYLCPRHSALLILSFEHFCHNKLSLVPDLHCDFSLCSVQPCECYTPVEGNNKWKTQTRCRFSHIQCYNELFHKYSATHLSSSILFTCRTLHTNGTTSPVK